MRPSLLVRSGEGTPMWVSPLECQKLASGTSIFECCENNHTVIKVCRRPLCLKSLDEMIERRARSLFASNNFAEARFTLCFRNCWCRGLLSNTTEKSWDALQDFKSDLEWNAYYDNKWIDRETFPLLAYASSSDCLYIVQQALAEISKIADTKQRRSMLQARIPKCGIVG